MTVPKNTLKLLAAATWYLGAGILLYKGSGYLVDAGVAGRAAPPVLAGSLGLVLGVQRGRTRFIDAARRNLARIEAIERPRVWQIFRPVFFAALALMFAVASAFSWLAGTGYWGAVVVGGLELVIGMALLTSSVAFWRAGSPRQAAIPAEQLSGRESQAAGSRSLPS